MLTFNKLFDNILDMKYKDFFKKHYQIIVLIGVIIFTSIVFAWQYFINNYSKTEINEYENYNTNEANDEKANSSDDSQQKEKTDDNNEPKDNQKSKKEATNTEEKKTTSNTTTDNANKDNAISEAKDNNDSSLNDEKKTQNNQTVSSSTSSNSPVENTPKSNQDSSQNTEQVLTQHEKNSQTIKNIYNTYGYKIDYGEAGYCYNGYCDAATNEEDVADVLSDIKYASSKFPTNFFKKFQGVNGYRVYIYGNIPGKTSGVASYEFGNDNVLYLNASSFDSSVYYHETFHLIERYINVLGGSFDSSVWASFNPPNYKYGQAASFYYRGDLNPNDYFLYEYGQTNEREDRATLFADLMIRGGVCKYGSYKDYMTSGTPTNLKFKYMVSVINKYFSNSNAYWNYCVR